MDRLPITAIVIYHNERRVLGACLEALRFCDEVIAVDMASSDGSLSIARRLADRVVHTPLYPIAEPARVASARLARHDWVMLMDPDMLIPPDLAVHVAEAMKRYPDAGAFSLPQWYYFKGRRLMGTIWGALSFKQVLVHRRRCDILPLCNRLTELRPGYRDVRIAHTGDNHIRHYWSNSYRELLRRHLRRYSHTEAAARVSRGARFGLWRALAEPIAEANRSLRHYDGWRLGPRGFILTGIYTAYCVAAQWLTLYYQLRGVPPEAAAEPRLPTLTDDTPPPAAPVPPSDLPSEVSPALSPSTAPGTAPEAFPDPADALTPEAALELAAAETTDPGEAVDEVEAAARALRELADAPRDAA